MTNATINPEAKAALLAADAIATAADAAGRDLTASEAAQIQAHLKTYHQAKNPPRGFTASPEVKALLADLGHDGSSPSPSSAGTGLRASAPDYKQTAAARWAREAADRLRKTSELVGGMKSIVGTITPVPDVINGPVNLPEERRTILNLIPTRTATGDNITGTGGNVFGYAVQSVRQNNANAVLQAGLKPESVYQWQSRVDRFRKIAHRSEPQPDELLADFETLVGFLRDEMGRGVLDELESQIIAGTGTIAATPDGTPTVAEEQLPGILNTSGVLAQAWDTDLLTTMSAAYDKLVIANEEPSAWVLHPLDYRRLKNMRESGSTGPLMFKSGRSSIEQVLGEIPVITSTLIPQGTGLIGDFAQTVLVTRQDVTIQASNGDSTLFDYNLTKFIAEGRWGFAVLRPSAFAVVDLTP